MGIELLAPETEEKASEDEWDIDPTKACNRDDPDCEACQ